MKEALQQTVAAANSAERALVEALDAASAALDRVATDPLADALVRLEASVLGAHERLQAGRDRAKLLVVAAAADFVNFQDVIAGKAEADVPALPAPKARTRRGRGKGRSQAA